MSDQLVSMKELRENFSRYKAGLERGESYTIIYRSKPLARLTPPKKQPTTDDIQKNVEMVDKLAGGIDAGEDVTPKIMNDWYEESYDEVLH